MPENVTIASTDFQSANITWAADASNHTLAYVVNVFNTIMQMYDTVYSNNVTISGLYPNMEYSVRVRAQCSATTYSDWGETVLFTTSACQEVEDVTIANVTDRSAEVSWTPRGDATQWEVTYGYRGFDEGTGFAFITTTPSVSLDNLQPETDYDVYVRSLCSDLAHSLWSRVLTFTTLAPVGIDNVEGELTCTIYPNPASTETTITIAGANGTVSITVVDMDGRTVAADQLSCNNGCTKQMTLQGLAQGAYLVRIVGDNVNIVRKLVVR